MKEDLPLLSDIINELKSRKVLLAISLIIAVAVDSMGQCLNPPTLTLSESSGSTCYLVPVTVSNNIFGGSATLVKIQKEGKGSVTPSSASSSPFSFTYLPDIKDIDKPVIITVTTNNPLGGPCKEVKATYTLTVTSSLPAPVPGNIIQPTCTSSTGSVELNGLPAYADWIITIEPGGLTKEGSGATTTVTNLPPGTYTFTVALQSGCSSTPSGPALIQEQPSTPAPPLAGNIVAPTCSIPTGSVTMTGLPSAGTWTLTRFPGTVKTTGTGTSIILTGISPGTFNFTVTNQAGCISLLSPDVTIPAQPPNPSPPIIGNIVQPTPEVPTGSVTLNGLPATGTWTLIRNPGKVTTTGSGTTYSVSGLADGTYTFAVKNNSGCTSAESSPVIISTPELPLIIITDPLPVCYSSTVDLTAPEITAGSTAGLTYTYWIDQDATIELTAPESVTTGTFYIKGISAAGFFDIKPVIVTVKEPPVSDAGPDQTLAFDFSTTLEAVLGTDETGTWSAESETVVFSDLTDPHSTVSNLRSGKNVLTWIVSNGACPADTGYVSITTGEILLPTLLTPNGDSKNEYFIIQGLESMGKTEFTVFDRRGLLIFEDKNYKNKWNGVDFNEKPVASDTYFYIIKSAGGKTLRGYIMIRK